jgi:hypothetical protein
MVQNNRTFSINYKKNQHESERGSIANRRYFQRRGGGDTQGLSSAGISD